MKPFAQKLLAVSLMVFLSGACCLLCAVPGVIAAAHCPMERSDHCNKKAGGEASSSPSVTREDQDNVLRCPFISKRSELAQKPNFDANAAVIKAAGISLSRSFSIVKTYVSPHSYRSIVRDRGSTYLNNCVFRI